MEINYWTNGKICAKVAFPIGIRKVINLSLKAEKQLQNENHTEDWALGSHPRDNGHVFFLFFVLFVGGSPTLIT